MSSEQSMSNTIASDMGSGRVPAIKKLGFYANWGPQAWIDMWMSNNMLVKKGMLVISHTYLPILRLCADPEQIDRDYQAIRARREETKLLDSPREKWRKRYGNFVRECEWSLLEIRKHYSQKQYEDIVVGTNVAIAKETSADFLDMMNSMSDKKPDKKPKKTKAKSSSSDSKKPSRWSTFLFETFNPAHWLTGPASVTHFDPDNGLTIMEIPDCGWHTCAKAESLPNPDALPQEGCLLICKGAFEDLFHGAGGGLKMEFDPHLPETSCTVRMSWQVDQG